MTTITTRSRARGAMAGLAIGDALGRPVEGLSAAETQERFGRVSGYVSDEPAGSDDTEYALLSAKTVLDFGIDATSSDFANVWRADVLPQADDFKGGGFSEMAAIDNLRRGLEPPLTGDHIHSWSDGLAMRVAPLGIVANGRLDVAERLAIADGTVSHAGEGILAGVVVAVTVSAAMAGADAEGCFQAGLNAIPADSWTARNLIAARDIVARGGSEAELARAIHDRMVVPDYFWADLAPEAVGIAMAGVLAGKGDFSSSVLFAVNIGRDADTNAAIAGAVCGAIHGLEAIPADWVAQLRPVEGSCIRSVAGIHPLDTAELLIDLVEGTDR